MPAHGFGRFADTDGSRIRPNTVSYAYHKEGVRCTYCQEEGANPWNKDNMCPGSVLTPNVTINFNNTKNMTVDLWRYEWWSKNGLMARNLRNWYFAPGSNIPLRVAEDLDTGHTDFHSFEEVASPGVSDKEMMDGIVDLKEYHVNGIDWKGQPDLTGCPGPDQFKALKPGELPECSTGFAINARKTWPQTSWKPQCLTVLISECAPARTKGGDPACMYCAGTHQADLHGAGCSQADITQFCAAT